MAVGGCALFSETTRQFVGKTTRDVVKLTYKMLRFNSPLNNRDVSETNGQDEPFFKMPQVGISDKIRSRSGQPHVRTF